MSGYRIEDRGGTQVLVWPGSGCRPATTTEVDLWDRLECALAGEAAALDEVARLRDTYFDTAMAREQGIAEADARWQARVERVRVRMREADAEHRRIDSRGPLASDASFGAMSAWRAALAILDGDGERSRVIELEHDDQVNVAMQVQGAASGEYTEEVDCQACAGTGVSRLDGETCGACGGPGASWRMRDGISIALLVHGVAP